MLQIIDWSVPEDWMDTKSEGDPPETLPFQKGARFDALQIWLLGQLWPLIEGNYPPSIWALCSTDILDK